MDKRDSGTGVLKAAKFLLIVLWLQACEREQVPCSIDNARTIDPYGSFETFWSSSQRPGLIGRSLAFNQKYGVYCYWEAKDIGPNSSDHSSKGIYSESNNTYSIYHPFGNPFVMKRILLNNVECLLPDNMRQEDAIRSGWLLIRREGASIDNPFGMKESTRFDRIDAE